MSLVKDQDGRVLQQSARNSEPLPLPAAQFRAPFADHGVVALRKARDEVVRHRILGRVLDLFKCRIRLAVADVLHHGAIEQESVLDTIPICARSDCNCSVRMSYPSTNTAPEVTSTNRGRDSPEWFCPRR
jgi:hypothetical protein